MPFRLALDMGTSSIGWALIDLDDEGRPSGIKNSGVRIFSDGRNPKSGTSRAVDRRLARQARRQRDRYLRRRTELMDALIEFGLMPADRDKRKALEKLDPYELRARALDEVLKPYELGRALFHLNQRRGFKSNRKTDRGGDSDRGVVRQAISDLTRRIDQSKARTLGEYLHRRRKKGKPARREYTDRAMYEEEVKAILGSQCRFRDELTPNVVERLLDIIFYQRPLRPVDPGRCTLDPSEQRAAWAHPLAQKFRIYQELNNLRIMRAGKPDTPLSPKERDLIFRKLERQKTVTFKSMRKALGLKEDTQFNLEWENRKYLLGNQTAVLLAGRDFFGPRWHKLAPALQDQIIATLIEEESEDAVFDLAVKDWGLDEHAAERVVQAPLPTGYARVGQTAMSKIVPIMRDQGLMYSDAAEEAGYKHSDFRPGELLDRLPYYGEVLQRQVAWGTGDPDDTLEQRHGRIANPTVHIGLNQLRKITNAVVERYGRPKQITVELARDLKLSRDSKIEVNRTNRKNQETNDRIAGELRKLGHPVNREYLQRWKLWEELGDVHDRRCVFSGRQISVAMLLSNQIEIEHLLPFSRTLDDSMANRTVCTIDANRAKGNKGPFEAFGANANPSYNWEEVSARASKLPKNKRWRFSPCYVSRHSGARPLQ